MPLILFSVPFALLLAGAAPDAGPTAAAFPPAERAAVVDGVTKALGDYTFADLVPKLRAAVATHRDEYLALDEPKAFAASITATLYGIAHDKHLRLSYSADGLPNFGSPSKADAQRERQSDLFFNYGFTQITRLPGNVGYLKMAGFPSMPQAKTTIDGALAFLANTDALIVDLRENHGGDPDSLDYMMGYFLAKPTELTSIVWSTPSHHGIDRQFSAATVAGKRYVGKPIYVLISASTFSCAEQFTYDMKALHRATIVGETTAGGANPGDFYRVDPHFDLFVPQGQALNPYTHANWEGTGIAPDVATSAHDALLAAFRQALADANDAFPASAGIRTTVLQDPAGALAKALPD